MSPALNTVLLACLRYAWRMKKREATLFIGERDVDFVHQQMLDRGFKVEFQDVVNYGNASKKMTLRW
jgi:hypothetical protein